MTEVAVHPSISRTPLPLDADDLPTVCVLCSHNCGIRVDVREGKIAKIRADDRNPVTKGYICNKAFEVDHYVDHRQRVLHPLRRRPDGTFEEIDWETAISEIAGKLVSIRETHSPRSIGLVGIGGQANHMDAPYGLAWLNAVGTKRWFNAFAQEKHQHFLMDQWMFDSSPAVYFHPDIEEARYLLVLGTNPKISNRGHNATDTFKALAKDETRTVVVVDPRETETTRSADQHVRIRPGGDAYLLLGIAAVIASSEGLADARFIGEKSVGFDELLATLRDVDVEEMARRAGLPAQTIVELARGLAEADSAAIMFDLAVEQNLFSTLISYLIRVIAALTGNLGKRGGNVFVEMATVPQHNPKRRDETEHALASGIPAIRSLGGYAMFSPTLVPEEVLLDHPERLRALVVEGANPFLSYSDTGRWREARDKLDLLVVIEPAMTESAMLADYVLPTPVGYEKWEIASFPKGYPEIFVQLRPPVLPAKGEGLPEPEIYARLVEAMGLVPEPPEELRALAENALEPNGAMTFLGTLQQLAEGSTSKMIFWGYRSLGPVLPSPAVTAIWAQAHQNALLRTAAVVRALGPDWADKNPFEIAAETFRRILDHPEGVEMARADVEDPLDSNIGFPDKKVRLAPAPMLEEIRRAQATDLPTDPDYPFVLAAGLRTRWTANTIQRNPEWRKGKGPHCALHLSPTDADRLGVGAGDPVKLSTRRAAVELPAAIDKGLQEGHVWIPNGFGARYPDAQGVLAEQGVNVNELTDVADRDPISGCPHHKYTLCRVERAA